MRIKDKALYTFIAIMIYLGLCVFFYPVISDAWNQYVANQLISDYTKTIQRATIDNTVDLAISRAQAYNRELYADGANHIAEYTERIKLAQGIVNDGLYDEDGTALSVSGTVNDESYIDTMNIKGDGIMGYLEIPSINVSLPVGHWTTDEVLATKVGHLYGTSVPIGGTDTHAVLTGHRGLASAKLFSDLDKVAEGDEFYIEALGKTLAYKVIEIKTVLPSEIDSLGIEEGRDLVTLVTCTPYGINTHRLLITGERTSIAAGEEGQQENVIYAAKSPMPVLFITALSFIILLVIIISIWARKGEECQDADARSWD